MKSKGLVAAMHAIGNQHRRPSMLIGEPRHLPELVNDLERRGQFNYFDDGHIVHVAPLKEVSLHHQNYVKGFPGYVPPSERIYPPRNPPGMPPMRLDESSTGPPKGKSPPVVGVEFIPYQTRSNIERADYRRSLAPLFGGLLLFLTGALYWLIGHRERLQEELHKKRLLAMLGEMSAVISHELRNPLAAAMGQAELLEAYLDEESRAYDKARRINHELERLETLANDLLNFVNSGRINLEEIELSPILDIILHTLRDPRIEVELADNLPEKITCDAGMLGRAIENVLDNALKVTSEDQSIVTMKIFVRKDDHLHILIEDEGPGLPEGVELFKPFVTTREKGTGLGLAIASEIISAHGGTIAAMNRADRSGARFLIRVPLALTLRA